MIIIPCKKLLPGCILSNQVVMLTQRRIGQKLWNQACISRKPNANDFLKHVGNGIYFWALDTQQASMLQPKLSEALLIILSAITITIQAIKKSKNTVEQCFKQEMILYHSQIFSKNTWFSLSNHPPRTHVNACSFPAYSMGHTQAYIWNKAFVKEKLRKCVLKPKCDIDPTKWTDFYWQNEKIH